MNTPVDFELSKLLKEKGFDELCLYHYSLGLEKDNYKQLQCHIDYSQVYDIGPVIPIIDNYFPLKKKNSEHYTPSAPTITDIVMWLLDKHEIWIDVSIDQFSKPKNIQWMYSIVFLKNTTYSNSTKSYNSTQESYKSAIEFTLKKFL